MFARTFSPKKFETVLVSPDDAKRKTDCLRALQNFLCTKEEMYPNIDTWFREKVVPGIGNGSRTACIGFFEGKPQAAAVLKHGESAKICHLNISEQLQGRHIGELFLFVLFLQVMGKSKRVHFTLPESLWAKQGKFFQSFGFNETRGCSKNYRNSERELLCSADIRVVLKRTIQKVSKLLSHFTQEVSTPPALLLSIKPKYASKILEGKKTVEVRRKFSRRHSGRRIALYASSPTKAIVGEATISDIENSTPEHIWRSKNHLIGCSYSDYQSYVRDLDNVNAIDLVDVKRFDEPLRLHQLSSFSEGGIRPPQSYALLEPGDSWSDAVSASRLLHQVSSLIIANSRKEKNRTCS